MVGDRPTESQVSIEVGCILPPSSAASIATEEILQHLVDTALDYESMNAKGTFLGSGGVIVIDNQTCIVDALWNITRFYEHESCGKCTPCREGTYWMAEVLERLENGHGKAEDIDLLADVADNILGKSFCALGDAAAMPVQGALKHFRDEFEYHVTHKACLANRRRSQAEGVRA